MQNRLRHLYETLSAEIVETTRADLGDGQMTAQYRGDAMRRFTIVSVMAVALIISATTDFTLAQSAAHDPLQLEAKIALGDVAGRIDHMAVDLMRRRLFVAELGNNTVGIIDLDARKVVHRISGLKEPQGVAYVQANDTLYVANAGDGSVRIFRGSDYTPAGRIDLGEDADNIRTDAAANRLLVGYGNGAIAVVDLPSNSKIKAFVLKAHPESFQLDAATNQLFVNLPDARSIAVLDGKNGERRASWPMRYGGNFAMALDPARQRVLVVFRNPAKFAAFDEQNGALVSEADACGDADDLFLDPKRTRIYVSCGAGFIDVLDSGDPKYSRLARITTVSGARTALFVREIDRLLLAVRARSGEPAAIWVYRIGGPKHD
jgi:YVTN family beta-propeller protein